MTDSAATAPTTGSSSRTVADLQRALAQGLASNPLLNSESGWRSLTARLARQGGPFPPAPGDGSRPADRIGELVAACGDQADDAEALADALDHVTRDPGLALPLRTFADWLTARTLLSDAELDELRGLLDQVPAHQATAAAQACLPFLAADLPAHCTGTWPTTLHLLRRNMLPTGLPPLLAYLEHLAAARPAQESALHAWAGRKAEDWGLTEKLQACRTAAADFVLPERSPARVMFVLLPDGLQKDTYTLRMWHREGARAKPALRDEDTQAVSHTELRPTVAQRLRQWVQETSEAVLDDMCVEFWLPLPLINEPVWDWCADATQPAHPARTVLIRSLDRLQIPTIQSAWRARWDSLMHASEESEEAESPDGGTTVSAPHDAESHREPATPPRTQDPVILKSPPSDKEGRLQFLDALRSGAPAILWHRLDCSAAFQSAALRLIGAGPLQELPDRISALRADHRRSTSADDAVTDITLLWDDPTHTLPTLHSLVAPSEARVL
ncbi:hypothetical protein [Streptomyces sp. NPDC059402]|jgi:hypothetical protein|uniref:VMAP-C domain-containing protein n=1 Tax=unclassified Streptomyces TaxID=2593676 RepID=UPI0036818278